MTYGTQKSDPPIVAMKPANKPEHLMAGTGAESVEPRGGAKGNAEQSRTCRTQGRESVFQRLDRVRQAARQRKKEKFTALMQLVDVELLRESYFWLKPKAAAGVDGVTWQRYGEGLEERLEQLHGRIHRNAYRATPSRRQYIPKADGRMRPLGIAALEDKIVQRALVEVLNAVYEQDFLGFSYGFRPQRSQHQALDALSVGITRTNVSWIVDADIKSFFDAVSHEWLITTLKRIKEELRRRWHISIHEQGKWLRKVVQGYFGYHAVSGNYPRMRAFRNQVTDLWRRALRRRGQRDRTTWSKALRLAAEWLPQARVLHPWPNARFDATHPRQEPGARIVHAGICAGGAR